MTRKRGAAVAAALVGFTAIGANVLPSAAQAPPQITTEFLSGRAVFPDNVYLKIKIKDGGHGTTVVHTRDASRTVTARFTVPPDAQFPWHTHAGPVVVNVVQGALTYVEREGCRHTTYPAGTAFVDPGHGHVHSAFNATDENTVLVATFFEAPPSGPLLIPAPTPADCTL